MKSREENFPVLSTFFESPVEIRKIRYTTNIIEGLNRQFRQITKNKPSLTNDDSLRRMLYLASQRIVKHWHAGYQGWDLGLSHLEILLADRAVGCLPCPGTPRRPDRHGFRQTREPGQNPPCFPAPFLVLLKIAYIKFYAGPWKDRLFLMFCVLPAVLHQNPGSRLLRTGVL